jgi:asparagine synthase (glutamine-hydrolysing)
MSTTCVRGVDAENLIARFSPRSETRPERSAAVVGHHLAAEAELSAIGPNDLKALTAAPGCFSVVLSDAAGLLAYADPPGQFPLFSARTGDSVLVGSSASALAAEVGASVDLVALAARVACPDTPDLFGERTMYTNVRRIPEGTVFQVDERGTRQTEHGRIRPDPNVGLADTAELLRDRLRASVRARVASADRLSSDFSGGFDSTSLAFLVATEEKPVIALTSDHDSMAAGSDDVELARSHARLDARLAHHVVVPSADHLPFQHLAAAGDEPHPTPMFLGPLRARLAAARDAGADLHLVGEGGDVLLGAPPAYLADLARDRDFATLWRHCVGWARLRTTSPLRLYRRAMALGTISRRRALLALARDIDHGRSATTSSWEDDWICYWRRPRADWLTTRARRQLATGIRELTDHESNSISDRVTRSWLRNQALTQRAVRDAGREFGISVHAPFLDSEVVRACLSLPARRRADPTVYKPLLRTALSGLVPEAALSHPVKGDYSKEIHHGVRRAAPALRRLLTESAAADYGLIEPRPVLAALDSAIQGLPTPWHALNQVIAVELWLREIQGKGATA